MDVAVVGGGAVGVTAAHDLAERGADVTLYERSEIAAGASGRAAGVCYDAYADARDADLARRALERFRSLDGTDEFAFVECPYVWLAREGDDRLSDVILEQVRRMRENGLDVHVAGADELADRWPALVTDDVAVAAVAGNVGYADPGGYTRRMADRARDAGVDIRAGVDADLAEGQVVRGVEPTEYDAVLVAAGARSAGVLSSMGVEIPVEPYRVQALVTESVGVDAPMLFDATGGYYLRPRGGGVFVGDGTEPVERDPDDWNSEADDWFERNCLGYEEAAFGRSWLAVRAWAGLCTATPDGDPLVGEVAPGVFVATGWQGHGFMWAPAVGERLAEQVLGGDGIRGFDPSRFHGDEEFEIVEGMVVDER